jgi:hypothetical protein
MVEHRFGSQREWMIQRGLVRQKGWSAMARARIRAFVSRTAGRAGFGQWKCFSALQTAFPSRY